MCKICTKPRIFFSLLLKNNTNFKEFIKSSLTKEYRSLYSNKMYCVLSQI